MVKLRRINPPTYQPNTISTQGGGGIGDLVKDGVTNIGKDLPPGLEPKGDGWYGSPDVIDPRDCVNYPRSIWCGGNPVQRPSTSIGVDIDWGISPCGVWGSATGTVFGLELPTHTRAYVHEHCRQDYERKELDRKYPPPVPPPDWRSGGWEPTPQYRPSGFRLNDQVCVITTDTYYREIQEWHGEIFGWAVASYFSNGIAEECLQPTNVQVARYLPPHNLITANCSVLGKVSSFQTANPAWVWAYRISSEVKPYTEYPPPPYEEGTERELILAIPYDLPRGNQFTDDVDYRFRGHSFTGEASTVGLGLYLGKFGDIFPNYQLSPITYGPHITKDQWGRTIGRNLVIHTRQVQFCIKIDGSKPSKRPHRDSPPPPKKDCCMQCCSSGQGKQDQDSDLLKKILKELQDLKKVVGFSEYPVKVPATFNRELRDNGSRVDPPTIQINNLTQLQGWQMKVFDAILGDWEVGFELKDTDPNKEGDQPGRIVAPNISALLTEQFSLIFDMWLMQYQQTHLAQRHVTETMLAKKLGVQNNFLLDAIADYLGFAREEKTKEIEFLFNLDAEKLEDFIQNSKKEILIQEYNHDNKKNPSLRDEMLIMRMAASIIQAVHTRKFDIKGDVAAQLVQHFTKLNENTEKVNKDAYKTGEGDFEQWLREAENAFINRDPLASNPTQPYGVPLGERPRLKKITDSTPDDPTQG